MQQIFTFSLSMSYYLCFRLTDIRAETNILPRQQNRITPFFFEIGPQESEETVFSFEIECGQMLTSKFVIQPSKEALCFTEAKNLTSKEINALFNSVFISRLTQDEAEDTIAYKIRKFSGYQILQNQDFSQKISVKNEIPIDVGDSFQKMDQIQEIQANSVKKILALTISESYFFNSDSENFELVKENWPSTVKSKFDGPNLLLIIPNSSENKKSLQFDFFVRDKSTGLLSKKVSFSSNLKQLNANQSKRSSYILLLIFLCAFAITLAFVALLFCLLKKSTKTEKQGRTLCSLESIPVNLNAQDQGSEVRIENFLSHSILNWNKQVIENRKARVSLEKLNNLPANIRSSNCSFNYEHKTAGESRIHEQSAKEIAAEDFDNLSVIGHEEPAYLTKLKSFEFNKQALFLDQFEL